MGTERWQRIDALVGLALDLDAEERAAFLDARCGDDRKLRREVLDLLEADAEAGGFLDRPAARIAPVRPPVRHVALEPAVGDQLGPFRLLHVLGRGGMGVVYLAERADDAYEQRVALKVVRQDLTSEPVEARFRAERQILARLEHPSIARLLDGGTSRRGFSWLAMEYVDGLPIDRFADLARLDVRARLRLVLEVATAVHHAHQRLVIHRDLKPSNILVKNDGTVKLLDFGIAKLLRPDPTVVPTEITGSPVTPSYASPEQLTGRSVTTASDVYALGVILHLLLVGRLPRRASSRWPGDPGDLTQEPRTPSTVLRTLESAEAEAVAADRGTSSARLVRRLSGDLDAIVAAALRTDPTLRYGSVTALADDLGRHLDGQPIRVRPPSWTYLAGKLLRRHRAAVAAAVAFVALLAAFAVSMALQRNEVARERDRAEAALVEAVSEQKRSARISRLMMGTFADLSPDLHGCTYEEMVASRQALLEDALPDDPALRADLYTQAGLSYGRLGHHDEAEALLAEALDLRRTVFPADHEAIAESLSDLALAVGAGEPSPEALELLERAFDIHRRQPIDDVGTLTRLLTRLAESEEVLGDPDRAVELWKQVADLQEQIPLG
jgi:serine/threonine-protein kinase